ncbi:hypothetical protein QYB59_000027 [Clostridium perfringens]|nr:hypothetical protein [Clostridium perfringens]
MELIPNYIIKKNTGEEIKAGDRVKITVDFGYKKEQNIGVIKEISKYRIHLIDRSDGTESLTQHELIENIEKIG